MTAMNTEEEERFEIHSKALIKLLNDIGNPHAIIILNTDSAQLLEGKTAFYTDEFVKD